MEIPEVGPTMTWYEPAWDASDERPEIRYSLELTWLTVAVEGHEIEIPLRISWNCVIAAPVIPVLTLSTSLENNTLTESTGVCVIAPEVTAVLLPRRGVIVADNSDGEAIDFTHVICAMLATPTSVNVRM